MIFVTVGSQLPFDRLVRPVVEWARHRGRNDLVFQHGGGDVDLSGFQAHAFVGPEEADRLLAAADVVVAHVGMGTVLTCLEFGKPIIVMPRQAALHETRNDHQSDSAKELEGRAGIFVAWNEQELVALLERAAELRGGSAISSEASPELIATLHAYICAPKA